MRWLSSKDVCSTRLSSWVWSPESTEWGKEKTNSMKLVLAFTYVPRHIHPHMYIMCMCLYALLNVFLFKIFWWLDLVCGRLNMLLSLIFIITNKYNTIIKNISLRSLAAQEIIWRTDKQYCVKLKSYKVKETSPWKDSLHNRNQVLNKNNNNHKTQTTQLINELIKWIGSAQII